MNLNDLLKTKAAQDPVNRERLAAAARSVGAISHREREQTEVRALVSPAKRDSRGKGGVGYIITITSYRRKLLDDDNLIAGAKACRDSIAASCGVDDADPRLRWEYRQLQTDGAEGTLVTISRVCLSRTSRNSKPS